MTFQQRFGDEPTHLAIAPGRVNLIGEHTDYNDGFVFPAAIDKQIRIAASLTAGPTRLHSNQGGEGQEFDSESVDLGEVQGWAKYAAGMAWVLRTETGTPMPNIQVTIDSSLPMASGVSSSAAIEMAFGCLWNDLAGIHLDNKHLALLAQRCENQYVGVNCGIMDQMASAMGKAGMAMFLDTRSLDIQYAKVPEDLMIVICDTKKPRALSESAYNQRRAECEEAAKMFGVKTLRDALREDLDAYAGRMSETAWHRARHVITENQRCLDFCGALKGKNMSHIGELMYLSHVSLRDDYEVSCPELDAMAEICWTAPGCVGARMTGAGFGGACVALVANSEFDKFKRYTESGYRQQTGLSGVLIPCMPVAGASCSPL